MKIAFIGKAGVGKTTLAVRLKREFGFERLSFAAPIKKMAQQVYFWKPLNKKECREFLQAFGDGARQHDSTVWIRHLEMRLRQLEAEYTEDLVVDDCRYLNEAQFLRNNGFIIVRLLGKGYDYKGEVGEHVSETQLDEWTADYQVDCSGDDLESAWTQLVELLCKLEGVRL